MAPTPEKLRKWFGPMPGHREARALSWMALAAGIILCGLSVFRGFQGETFMGRPLGGDFVQFYVIGKILNTYAAPHIYDLELAVRLQHAVLPSMPDTQMLVFAHAPYIAELFRPFALLPYRWAYVVWLGFSALLYLTGLGLLLRSARLSPAERRTGFLLAVSCTPFLLETWIGGQISVVVFLAWTLFLFCRSRNSMFLAGLALSLAIFKPTLIAFPVAMLICGRRWRPVGGFAAGAAVWAAFSIRLVGLEGCRAWVNTMLYNGRTSIGSGAIAHYSKNIDINSFLRLLAGNAWTLTALAAVVIGVFGFAMMARAWSRSRAWNPLAPAENLLLASTLCFTLVLSSYAPIYDSLILVVAATLAAGAIGPRPQERETLAAWLTLLYIVPCITQSFAEFLHVQLFTPVVAGLGFWALKSAYFAAKSEANAERPERSDNSLDLQQVAVTNE